MTKFKGKSTKTPAITRTRSAWVNRIVGEGDVDPRSLTAHPDNARTHGKEQGEALDAVLTSIGWVTRVVVNRRSGRIVDGHLRVSAAIQKGEATVPVVWVDLTEEEERTILALLDPIAAMAGMDDAKLKALLTDIDLSSDGAQGLIDSLNQLADEQAKGNPANVEFNEYDESSADGVETVTCPSCGHSFPK